MIWWRETLSKPCRLNSLRALSRSSRSLIPGMIGYVVMDIGLFAYGWTGIAGDLPRGRCPYGRGSVIRYRVCRVHDLTSYGALCDIETPRKSPDSGRSERRTRLPGSRSIGPVRIFWAIE